MAVRFAGILVICLIALTLAPPAASSAQLNPIQRLARDLGTPKLGYTNHNDARATSMFEFVRPDETVDKWTKLFTVVATQVAIDHTKTETEALILRLRGLLAKQHASVSAYDVRDHGPPVAFFRYVLRGEINVGAILSPRPGSITIQQVAAHKAGVITARDVARIKALVGYPK